MKKTLYSNGILLLLFKSLINDSSCSLEFSDVHITAVEFFNLKEAEGLALDNLYRGRTEFNDELIEVSKDGRGYFYLEFYGGQKLEFWARRIVLHKASNKIKAI